MKGGKAGRKRKNSGSGAARSGSGRDSAKKGGGKRAAGVAPKKGSRKKQYGGTSSTGDE